MSRTAILLAAYGSRHERARQSFDHIGSRVRAAHPGPDLVWAYTSKNVRRLSRGHDSVPQALEKLREAGVRRLAVQSLHMIPGTEFEETLAAVHAARDEFDAVEIGLPLLGGEADIRRVGAILPALVPEDRQPGEGVVFMGHGTSHPGHAAYEALASRLAAHDPRILLGALETGPTIEEVRERLRQLGVRRVYLVPLLFAAGLHVEHDMLGPEPESWQSRLAEAGIDSVPVVRGAGEYDALVDVWLDHLDDAMRRLGAA